MRRLVVLAAAVALWASQPMTAAAQPAPRPLVGIVDGLGLLVVNAAQPQRWRIVDLIAAEYEVVPAPLDLLVVPDAFDAIIVVHPFAMSDPTLFALEQYVMRGGWLLAFLDPQAEHSFVSPDNPNALANPDSYLAPLLAAWGVEMLEDRVAGDTALAIPVRTGTGAEQRVEAYIPWIGLTSTTPGVFNPDDPATAGLTAMMMQSPGVLSPIAGATTTFVPLVATSDAGGTVSQQSAMARSPLQVRMNFRVTGRQVLAARITGPVATAFPDGAPAGAMGGDVQLTTAEAVHVIVVADTDLLANELVTDMRLPDNAAFVLSALASLVAAP